MSEYLMYLRKSRQDDPNETVEEVLYKHEIQLQEYSLKNIGYRIPEKDIYREVVSGETIEDRPMIKKLFDRVQTERNDIKGVLIMDISRLTRGDLLDMGTVLHAFLYTNTLIITPPKTYNLSDKYDRKFFEMELSRGSDYLEYTKEILVRGRVASKRRGNFLGSIPPYGYDRVKIGKDWTLVPNPKEAIYIPMIFEWYLEGYGVYVIANKLDALGATPRNNEKFSLATLRNILRNEVYYGKVRIGHRTQEKILVDGVVKKKRYRIKEYELIDGKHSPLISEETFMRVKEKLGRNSKEVNDKELKNIWAGLIVCADCGRGMDRVGHKNRANRIRCRNQRICKNKSNNFEPIENAIIQELKNKLDDFTVKFEEDTSDKEMLITTLKMQIDEAKKKQTQICDYLENGVYTVDMFIDRNNKLKDEIERLEKALKNAEEEAPKVQKAKDYIVTFHETLDMLKDDSISVKTKNEYLKKIIKVIYYHKDENEITLDVHLLMLGNIECLIRTVLNVTHNKRLD